MSNKETVRNLGLGLCCIVWGVTAQAMPSLSIGSSVSFPGYYETIPITFTTDEAVSGLQFDLVYDPTQLDIKLPTQGAVLLSPGRIRAIVIPSTQANAPLPQGQLMTVQVTLKNGATGTAKTLTLDNVVMGDPTGAPVAATGVNGLITWETDSDHDGVPDGIDTDNDNDGIPDWYETKYGLNPHDASDAGLDPDGDGLTNLQEYQHNSNPHLADTDGDGIDDGTEVAMGRNPAIDDALIPAIITVINSLLLD